ncbi:MAG: NAD-dependent epimerase/dehydratase family protein [bacterium]|nr:NAD-dependent epimerase/dehydratase family protein [bacterium]
MSEAKALVMGASGFLGSHVVKTLAEQGRNVRIFTRASSDTSAIDHLEVEHAVGDVCDAGSLRQAMQGCSVIYYCVVDTRAWLKDPAPLRVTNVEGLRNVLEAAMDVGVERFIYTSTFMTLGLNPSGVATEADAFNWQDQASEYVRVRVEAENLFLEYCARGLPGVACNVAMTYGAEDRQPTPHGWLISLVLRGLLPAWDATFASVGIQDAAEAMVLAEEHGRLGERYLITDRTLPLREIWSTAVKAAGTPWPVYTLPMWVMYAGCWIAENGSWMLGLETEITLKSLRLTRIVKDFDNSKARKELHWNPRPVEESIAEAARWFHGQRKRKALRPKASIQQT